ncbi:LTA synthase family protein [Oscillospiraceae bacterium WX1]
MLKLKRYLSAWLVVFAIVIIKSYFVLVTIYHLSPATLQTLRFDFYVLAPAIFLLSFSLLLKKKAQYIYLLIADVLVSALFFADLLYCRAYGHLLTIYMILSTANVIGGLDQSAVFLLKATDFLLFLDLPLVAILLIKKMKSPPVKERPVLLKAAVFLIAAASSLVAMGMQFNRFQEAFYSCNVDEYPRYMSPLGDFMYNIYNYGVEKAYKLDDEDRSFIDNWFEDNQKYMAADPQYENMRGILKGKNIIVIQVESLENFVIDASFEGQEITPNLNALLDNSLYFSNIHEQTRDGNSSDAELLFNASLYPVKIGSAFVRYGTNPYQSLEKLVKKEGYTAVAIHGDVKTFWNRDVAYPNLGFDDYIGEDDFDNKESTGLGILDASLFTQSVKEIEGLKNPYLLFAITITSHVPFTIEAQDQTLTFKENNDDTKYLQSIHYTDRCIGDFIKELKAKGLLENTAVVIYGDHEGVHKYCASNLPDNQKQIPYIIYMPELEGAKIDKIGGQVDMLPTLAFLLGLDENDYSKNFMGRNLFGGYDGTVILSDGTILGNPDDAQHLKDAQEVADKLILGYKQWCVG